MVLSVLGILLSLIIILTPTKTGDAGRDSLGGIDISRLRDYKTGQAFGLIAAMLVYALALRPAGFLAATTLILSAAYSLWMVKRVVFGEIANDNVKQLEDVNGREFVILGSLVAVVMLFGLFPAPLVEVMHASVDQLLAHVSVSKLPTETSLALANIVQP